MLRANLLLDGALREQITGYFEARAEAVDSGAATVREGLAFLSESVFGSANNGHRPNADLEKVGRVIATVAWSDMSTAFSLWCQRMVLEYLSWSATGSPLGRDILPRLARADLCGSTALASAMAHFQGRGALPISAGVEGDGLVLNGRVSWASNLQAPDFVMVLGTVVEDGRRLIVAIPGHLAGVCVDPYPDLLALKATNSSSVRLNNVRLGSEWIITDDFDQFMRQIRPPFLLLQSCFCLGLADRALEQTRASIGGVNDVFRSDLAELDDEAGRLAEAIQSGLRSGGAAIPIPDLVRLRLDGARLATAAVALEAKTMGGRGYVQFCPTARRLREAAFLPIQTPTEGQLRWELARYAS